MRFGGWVFMAISWTAIISLAIFCFSKTFRQGLDGESGINKKNK